MNYHQGKVKLNLSMFSEIFMNVINSFLVMGIITFIVDINQQFLLFLNKAMMGLDIRPCLVKLI